MRSRTLCSQQVEKSLHQVKSSRRHSRRGRDLVGLAAILSCGRVIAMVTLCGMFVVGMALAAEIDGPLHSQATVRSGIHAVTDGGGVGTVVFVHGWLGSSEDWRFQMPTTAIGFRAVAIDLPGFGLTAPADSCDIVALSRSLAEFVEERNFEKVVLVGHSMGSAVVLEAANRLENRVEGLVLVDVLHDIEHRYSDAEIAEQISRRDKYIVSEVGARGDSANPECWRESLESYFQWRAHQATWALQTSKVQVLSINSDRIATDVEALRKYAPQIELAVIPNTSHAVMIDQPERFNELLLEFAQQTKIKKLIDEN